MDIKNGYHIKSQPLKININFQIFQWLNKSVPVLMGIFIFFNPFPHTTAVKEICFYLSAAGFFFLIIFKKNHFSFKTPFLLSFGFFVCWVFIGLFFALDKNNSIHDFYAHLLKYIVLYYIVINYFSTRKNITILSWIIISSSTIFAVGATIYFYFILGNPLSTKLGGPVFIQTPVNVIGVITVFAAILSMNNFLNETSGYRKLILIVCFFLQFILLVLTQTRAAFIPFCLAIVILFIKYKKTLIALLGIIFMVISFTPLKTRLLYDNHPLIYLRVGINYQTYEIIKDYPIIGIGFGMETFKNALDLKAYHKKVPEKYRENYIYDDPHNMFFDIAVRLGVVGLVLFFYIIFVFFKTCWEIIKYGKDDFAKNWGRCLAAALLSFLFIGFFHPVFSHMPETILCAMFSMLTIVWRLNNEQLSKDVA